jgi:RHS repeat-associated protein
MRIPRFVILFVLLVSSLIFVSPTFPQTSFGFVNNITAVPVPGVGHDYLHDLDEIVNPANGSLSVRIEAPRPKERGLNYPFYAFMYDSTQQFAVIYQQESASSYNCGPDTTSDGSSGAPPQPLNCVYPPISFNYVSYDWPAGSNGVLSGPNSLLAANAEYSREVGSGTFETCGIYGAYSYEDPYGVVHSLGAYSENSLSTNSGACSYLGISPSPLGGDEQYKIVLPDTVINLKIPSSGTLTSGYGALIDSHGDAVLVTQGGGGSAVNLAMEDTNGNAVNGTGRSGSYQSFQPWGDALASPKTASRTFAGGSTYSYTWGTATTTFSPSWVDESKIEYGFDNLCTFMKTSGGGDTTNAVVVKMQEPDGLYYTFSYDPTYGLLNKITYPTGAWVEYTWGVNSLSDASGFRTPGPFVNSYNDPIHVTPGVSMNASCMFEHDTPAVVKRVVSYDGVHSAQEQDFSYSTNWGSTGEFGDWVSKQTTVITKDLLTSGTPSFKTVYNYSPQNPYVPIGSNLQSSPLPIENTVLYYDASGSLLRTVTKAWTSYLQLAAECTTLPNGKASGTFYQYEAYPIPGGLAIASNPSSITTNLPTDAAEYDYGLVTTPCQKPSSTPTRETVTTYAAFSNTPLWPTITEGSTNISLPPMADRPATVITYQNGTAIAETDYAYDQTAVTSVSPTPLGHDEANYENGSTVGRGNLTTLTRKCFQGSTTCTNSVTTIAYDTTGQAVSVTDAKLNQIKLLYTDNYTTDDGSPSGNTNTYLTTIIRPTTNGVPHIETFQWDFNKGELRTLTDENSQQTSYQYLDPWWRLTKSTFPDGGSITKTYQDAGPNPTVTTNTAITSSVSLTSTTIMDAVGHVIHTQLNTDPDGPDYVDTVYDGLGRVASVSNPYRSTSDPTYGLTTFSYDSLDRKTVQVQPDGSKLQWCYENIASSGQTNCAANASSQTNTEWVDSSDVAGNHWQRTYDALGRLTSVLEPNGSSPVPSMETDYTYNALNDLTRVDQWGGPNGNSGDRVRTFSYDSLSRLLCASNPENSTAPCPLTSTATYTPGTTGYTYDANGNLTIKTSPAPNQTGSATVTASYSYDALNRLIQKSFSDGTTPTVKYGYDETALTGCTTAPPALTDAYPIGRRTAMCDGAGAESWAHDKMGRPLTDRRTTIGATKSIPYTYNLDGSLSSITYLQDTYPNIISYAAGGAGLPISAGNSSFALAYSVHYAPNGSLCSLGSAWGQPFQHDYTFNNRFQPITIQDWDVNGMPAHSPCSAVPPPVILNESPQLNLTYSYVDSSGHNNGNVVTIANNLDSHRTQSFTYDSLNRLASAQTAATNQPMWPGDTQSIVQCWSEQYSYDAWGNLSSIAPGSSSLYTGCTQESALSMSPTTKNQLQDLNNDYVYDAAGNLVNPGPTGTYSYDAENHLTSAGGLAYLYDGDGKRVGKAPAGTPTQPNYLYWYGTGSQILEETDGAGNYAHEDYYFNGMLLARNETDNWVDHFFADALGNTRCVYGDGNPNGGCSDYYPFGGERPIHGNANTYGVNVPFKFTGKERDSESGLDNFGARFDSSQLGRFMSPDNPKFSEKTDPQTWNLYSYVSNNPLARVDLTGDNWFNINGSWQWYYGANVTNSGDPCKKGAKGCNHSDYTHLLVVQKLNEKTDKGATEVKITLYDQNKVIAQGTGFTGGTNILSVPNGNYEINLNNRGGVDTNRIVPVVGGLVLGSFHDGIQEVGDSIPYQGALYDPTGEWGTLRANFSRGAGDGTQYYLHGKGLYFTEGHSYTAGCVCDPYQSVLKVIFRLDPSGVGEGDKNGRIAVSVNKPN